MTEFSVAAMTWAGLKSAVKAYYDSVTSTLTNKTIKGLVAQDSSDATKLVAWDLSTVPTATTRTVMAPVSRTSQFSLGNSTTETTILSMVAKAAALTAGATFRIRIAGSCRNADTSGTLTFRVYIGSTAAPQTLVIPTQATSASYKPIDFNADVVIRTSSASGTYAAGNGGVISVGGWYSGGSTTTGTSEVDCTADQTVKVTAQWASALANNNLLIETATIQQVV